MLWINTLLSVDATKVSASASFAEEDFPVREGSVLECAFVECIAQTVAAAAGYLASLQPGVEQPQGMLAAVSNFRIHAQHDLGKTLLIEVRERKRLGPLRLVEGQLTCEGELIASGELTLYVNGGVR